MTEEETEEVEEFNETPTKLKLTIPVIATVGGVETLTSTMFEFESGRRHFAYQLDVVMMKLGTLLGIIGPPIEAAS
jgi:hypothetical protein